MFFIVVPGMRDKKRSRMRSQYRWAERVKGEFSRHIWLELRAGPIGAVGVAGAVAFDRQICSKGLERARLN
jgi:hypothetical protein